MGDFSHGHKKWKSLERTGDEVHHFMFLEPIRRDNVLDIILSSQNELVDNVKILLGKSDHNQIHFDIKVKSPHLSSSGPSRVHLFQLALSAATRLDMYQQFHHSTRLSFSTVDRHVVFGRPTFLLPSCVQVNAVSHLLFLSIRRICPTYFNRLNLTSVLIVINFGVCKDILI